MRAAPATAAPAGALALEALAATSGRVAEAGPVFPAAAEQVGCFGPRLHPRGKPGPHNRGLQEKILHAAQALSAPTAEKPGEVLSC